jgi:GTP-binding protein
MSQTPFNNTTSQASNTEPSGISEPASTEVIPAKQDNPPFRIAFNSAAFLQSASKLSNCPPDNGIEIAFAGRSNAGKSSAINVITQNKKLARTSKTPGRTQLLNFFTLNVPGVRLVDLPGYGFAKVSLDMKAEWGKHLDDYLRNRAGLAALVLIMDIRKPLTPFDEMLLEWTSNRALPTLILLTKADKLNFGPGKHTVFQVKKALSDHKALADVILFSSLKKTGVKETHQVLSRIIQQRMLENQSAASEPGDASIDADNAGNAQNSD